MRLGQGSHRRSPWWCRVVMILAAAVTLPGAVLVVGANEERVSQEAGSYEANPRNARALVGQGERASTMALYGKYAFQNDDLQQLQANDDTAPKATWDLRQQALRLLGDDGRAVVPKQVKVVHAPRLTVFNGQTAFVRDLAQSPFVVGVKRLPSSQGTAVAPQQPIIRVVDQGLRLDLRPQLQDKSSVLLDFKLTLTQVVDVDEEMIRIGTTVQIPEVETTCLVAAAVLPVGKTLLIGGLKTRGDDGEPQSTLVMVSPTKVANAVAETP